MWRSEEKEEKEGRKEKHQRMERVGARKVTHLALLKILLELRAEALELPGNC